MNNKGMSFVFVAFLMFTVFILLFTIWQMGINDITLSKILDDNTKAYYIAEAGIYYGGSIILEAINNSQEPASTITVDKPFSEYTASHGFTLTITKEGLNYRVLSEGNYNNRVSKVEALITINAGNIVYSQFRKTS